MGLTWNLAVFGVLVTWAAGTSAAGAALSLARGGGRGSAFPASLVFAASLVVVGALVALLGMQHPERMVHLLANPAAAITQQIYALAMLLACIAAWFVARRRAEGEVARWASALVLIAGIAATVLVGRRYLVPSAALLNSWLWVAATLGSACCTGAATFLSIEGVCARRAAMQPGGVTHATTAFVVSSTLNLATAIAYAAFVQLSSATAVTSGIRFDPTHPALSAAKDLLGADESALLWGVGVAVGAVPPLLLGIAAQHLGKHPLARTVCGTLGIICAVAGMLATRAVAFGLI